MRVGGTLLGLVVLQPQVGFLGLVVGTLVIAFVYSAKFVHNGKIV